MSHFGDFFAALRALEPGERITVNGLAGRVGGDPRFARMALMRAEAGALVVPGGDYVGWVRTASRESA